MFGRKKWQPFIKTMMVAHRVSSRVCENPCEPTELLHCLRLVGFSGQLDGNMDNAEWCTSFFDLRGGYGLYVQCVEALLTSVFCSRAILVQGLTLEFSVASAPLDGTRRPGLARPVLCQVHGRHTRTTYSGPLRHPFPMPAGPSKPTSVHTPYPSRTCSQKVVRGKKTSNM